MKALEKEMRRVSESLDKGFIARNFTLKVVMCFVVYPIAALISAFTEGTHLYTNFNDTFANATVAWFLTGLIVLFIEVGQYFAINKVVDDLREGVYAESINHITAFVIALLVGGVLMWISVTLSIQGAPITNEHFKKQKTPLELVNINEINSRYDSQIAEENKTLGMANKMTWRGKIVEDGRVLAKKISDQKARIETNRQAEVAAAMAENKKREDEYNSKLQHSGAWFTRFAGLGEIIKLIYLIFLGNYEAGAKKEVFAEASPTGGASSPSGFGSYYNSGRAVVGGFVRRDSYPRGDHLTGLQPDATRFPETITPADRKRLQMALKNARANLAAWKSKKASGRGSDAANDANIAKWEAEIASIEAQLQTA